MKYKQGKYIIIKKSAIAKDIYSFEISCPEVVAVACPGQFVHIRISKFTLRRPISICSINKYKGTIRLVVEIRGDGTYEIAKLNEGDLIDMLAPLGHGFTIDNRFNKIILIGGGIGVPPLLSLANVYGDKAIVISGFRNREAVILQNDFKSTGAYTILCTDDGSAGIHGFVTQSFTELVDHGDIDVIYACGPKLMLKCIATICKERNIYCEISLEERMACGIGACLGCACRTIRNNEEYFAHVCKDGPVFNVEELRW